MEEAIPNALVDSAKGPCVQGGEPLVGGRGMVAHADCLWTAGTLPATEPAPPLRGRTGQGLRSVSCRDDESRETAPYRGGFLPRRGSGSLWPAQPRTRIPALNGLSHDVRAVATSPSFSPISRADRRPSDRSASESGRRHVCQVQGRQQPRSLSYLSLTLCCAALHAGWLKGCATPSCEGDAICRFVAGEGVAPDRHRDRNQECRRRPQGRWTRLGVSSGKTCWTGMIFP